MAEKGRLAEPPLHFAESNTIRFTEFILNRPYTKELCRLQK